MRKKFDSAWDIPIRDKVLPAELFNKKLPFFKFFDLIKCYNECSQISQKILGKKLMRENFRTVEFFPKICVNLHGVTEQ